VVTHLLEVVPQAGQTVALGDLRLTAHAVDDRRVREVLVEAGK
jgi:Mg2+/Co2+ transporter CorC